MVFFRDLSSFPFKVMNMLCVFLKKIYNLVFIAAFFFSWTHTTFFTDRFKKITLSVISPLIFSPLSLLSLWTFYRFLRRSIRKVVFETLPNLGQGRVLERTGWLPSPVLFLFPSASHGPLPHAKDWIYILKPQRTEPDSLPRVFPLNVHFIFLSFFSFLLFT